MSKKGLAALAVSALTCGLLAAGSVTAHADVAPSSADIVGVGSDTLQYMLDFGADGDFNGNAGYNVAKVARVVSFDATPDANARAGYLNGSTSSALQALNPTIVLRAGNLTTQRPNGSGSGLKALINDGASKKVNFVRSSSALDGSTSTTTPGVGSLHEIRLANDNLAMATATVTNAVALTKAQLQQVYLCTSGYRNWNDAAIGGTSATAIIPIVPQLGSGTRKTFLQDIGFTVNSDGTTTVPLGGCVKTDEENNPYSLYLDSSGNPIADPYATSAIANPNAIAPFSQGRLNLYAAGYFRNPNVAYNAPAPGGDQLVLNPGVKFLNTGTPPAGGAGNTPGGTVYNDPRGLYVVFRDSDVTSTAKFNGSSLNWVKTLFLNSDPANPPFFNTAAGQALLTSAGVTPAYADCGVNSTSPTTCS